MKNAPIVKIIVLLPELALGCKNDELKKKRTIINYILFNIIFTMFNTFTIYS